MDNGICHHHCGETVTIIAVTIIQDGGRRRWWVRAGSIVTLVRNTVLSYLYTIQGLHRSWFCVSCFVSLCICFWNMGLWNFRDMIVTYKSDMGDMIVTVHGVWSLLSKYDRNCRDMIVTVEYDRHCPVAWGDRNSRMLSDEMPYLNRKIQDNMDATRHVHLVCLRINHVYIRQ